MAALDSTSPNESQPPEDIWADRHVVVALSGGIACYKVATVVSRLTQAGALVRVVMTEAATRFITPLTFESLSGEPVASSLWDVRKNLESPHIALARWCELFILAPTSADMLARLAAGICDDVVSLTACALSAKTHVLLAPAMNEQMWENAITQLNFNKVKTVLGYQTVGPGEGWQSCRTKGAGRMSEPEEILAASAQLIK